MDFIIPENGSIENQEGQYLRVKKGSNIELTFTFYKDAEHAETWDLEDAAIAFYAKQNKSQNYYDIEKATDSSAWNKVDAEYGILGLVLSASENPAQITGNTLLFTGQAGDKIKVIVDGDIYDDIDISSATSIAEVAVLINAAVGVYVYFATVTVDGYLMLTSPTSGKESNVTIADGTSTTQTCVAEVFGTTVRTDVGEDGDLTVAKSLSCEVEFQPSGSERVLITKDFIIEIEEDVEN